jgi:hypothetical protein
LKVISNHEYKNKGKKRERERERLVKIKFGRKVHNEKQFKRKTSSITEKVPAKVYRSNIFRRETKFQL